MCLDINEYANKFYNQYIDSEFQINQGASVLLIKNNRIYFALAKEKSWKYIKNEPIIKFTGIGGTREKEEKIEKTLERELKEEVNIDIKDLKFPNIENTIIVKNTENNSTIKFQDVLNYNPLYIVEYKLPLRDDINITGKKYSCLQLFVYIAKANDNINIKPVENDNITGIISANGQELEKYLEGNCRVNDTNITWKSKYKNLKNIIINPKFTPQGIKGAGYKLEDLLNFVKGV